MKSAVLLACSLVLVGAVAASAQFVPQADVTFDGQGSVGPGVPAFVVRPGFNVTIAAENFGEGRSVEVDDKGTLYVGQPREGTITSLKDKDGDGVFETRAKFVTGRPSVHGMCFDKGWLYFSQASTGGVNKARDTNDDGVADEIVEVLPEQSVPAGGGGHPFRGIAVADDGAIFVTVSDPSNMLDELPSAHKSLYRFNADGSGKRQFATGIRNTEKIQFRPGTSEVWGLDHGSDNWGGTFPGDKDDRQAITDMNPPEEFNRFVDGGFYGHPFIGGNRVPRPEFAKRPDIAELASKTIPPAWAFGAHWAPNGFTFIKSDALGLKGDTVACFHGSWNSSVKVGYRVDRVRFDAWTGLPVGSEMLVGCVAPDGKGSLARPVDAVEAPDGSVIFSSDNPHVLYRLSKDDKAPK